MSGEPTRFSQELFDTICDRLADGESLRAICRNDDMPSTASVMRWLDQKEELREQYARAREAQADTIFDECLHIADTYDSDELVEPQHINRARLRIDTRKWMAGKLRPKKYSDKIVIGGDKELDAIQTEEVGSGAVKLAAFMQSMAERNR